MIYEVFVRKSFIRSSVYKIIIFAISFIQTTKKKDMQMKMEQNVRRVVAA